MTFIGNSDSDKKNNPELTGGSFFATVDDGDEDGEDSDNKNNKKVSF